MSGLTEQDKDFLRDLLTEMHASSVGANSQLIREINKRVELVEEETRVNTQAVKEMLPTIQAMNDAITTAGTMKKLAIYITTMIAALFAAKQLWR